MTTHLNFSFNETTEMLRESVRNFAAREIAPHAAKIDHDNHFPTALWKKLGNLGLLGITVEETYGGSGIGFLYHFISF